MKKTTLLVFLMIISLGYAQELVINGDFESGTMSWYGNALNPVDDGSGNFVNQAEITTAGDPWNVNISQAVSLIDGASYTFSFDAYTATGTTRTIIVGIGNAGAPYGANVVTETLTDVKTTYTYTMDANYGDVGASRVIFDMGADTGFVFIDNVSLLGATSTCNNGVMDGDETGIDCGGSCDACVMAPTMAAPAAPARPEADVVSIYSDSYTGNIAFDNFDAGWCGGAAVNGIMIAGNNTLEKKPGIDCHGIDFQSDRQDLSDFTHIHFDFYTNDTDLAGDVFNVKLVDFGGGGSESSALEVNINGGTMPQLVANQWVSVDLDITALGGIVTGSLTRSDIAQIGITTANVTNVWYDNIYLHKNTLLGIEDFNKTVFSTYPNPTKNSWTVKTESTKMTNIQLFDVLGKNVLSMSPNSRETKIDASNLKAGLYFARINTEFGTSSIKLIKN